MCRYIYSYSWSVSNFTCLSLMVLSYCHQTKIWRPLLNTLFYIQPKNYHKIWIIFNNLLPISVQDIKLNKTNVQPSKFPCLTDSRKMIRVARVASSYVFIYNSYIHFMNICQLVQMLNRPESKLPSFCHSSPSFCSAPLRMEIIGLPMRCSTNSMEQHHPSKASQETHHLLQNP